MKTPQTNKINRLLSVKVERRLNLAVPNDSQMGTSMKTLGVSHDVSAAVCACASPSRSNPKRQALWLVFDTAGLLLSVAAFATICLQPVSARAQGAVPLWTNRFDARLNSSVFSESIAVDGSGNVFVATSSYDAATNATIKYSNAGVPLWTNRYPGNLQRALALDSNDNVFLRGDGYFAVACSSAG